MESTSKYLLNLAITANNREKPMTVTSKDLLSWAIEGSNDYMFNQILSYSKQGLSADDYTKLLLFAIEQKGNDKAFIILSTLLKACPVETLQTLTLEKLQEAKAALEKAEAFDHDEEVVDKIIDCIRKKRSENNICRLKALNNNY